MADVSNINILDKYGINSETAASKKSNDLDKNAFLNLLVTQMRYQDPLNPTQDKEFLAQMAQFSSLEQMQNLNTSVTLSRGYELLNKYIYANVSDADTNKVTNVEGTVSGVYLENGKVLLKVGDKDVPIDKVEGILAPVDSIVINKRLEALGKDIAEIKEKYIGKEVDKSEETDKE